MRFVLLAWLLSRAVIAAAFYIASPHPIASAGVWDGAWYGSIAQHGYGFVHGAKSDVAFLPVYPLLASLLVRAGVTWPLAGLIVNNAAFLAALFVLYDLARKKWNTATARWCITFACVCPLSLFASVAYHEGIYLLCTALALRWALESKDLASGLAGAIATATALLGSALAGALVVEAILMRRGARAIAFRALAFTGIASFVFFCYVRFGDPLAFVHAEQGWRSAGVDIGAWLRVVQSLGAWNGFLANALVVALVPISAVALIIQRRALGLLMTLYGLFALAIIVVAGEPISADRYAFALVPVLFVWGRILERMQAAGFGLALALLALLFYDTLRFAQSHWVA